MGLNYLPLASVYAATGSINMELTGTLDISEADRLNANGPCCGAFYSDSDKPFIVLAFKVFVQTSFGCNMTIF